MLTLLLNTESETQQLAGKFAQYCPSDKRLVIFLQGELGVGKTTFVQALLKSLGYKDPVKSPTYTLVESYDVASYRIFHLDLYRLKTPTEILNLGLYDDFDQAAIWLVEWPNHATSFLPKPDMICLLTLIGLTRQIQLSPQTQQGQLLFRGIEDSL